MRNFYKLLSFLWLTIIFVSCEYDTYIPSGEIPVNVSYSTDVLPIFNASCNTASCHAAGAIPPDLSPENGYNYLLFSDQIDTSNAKNSILYQRMIDVKNPMPPEGLLSEYEINIVLGWIQQGAKNN